MKRRTAIKLIAGLGLLAGVGFSRTARAAEVIRIGTLMPQASPWGRALAVWASAVSKQSGGRVALQIFYGGRQGDEKAMVAKMKAGQLDGAFVTAAGLFKIYKPIVALEMPGLCTTWAKLDKARDAMKSQFEKCITDAGLTLAGWSDVGAVRLMSKGVSIHAPDDIEGKKPYMSSDDPIARALFSIISVTPVRLDVPEVLPSLDTGAVNIVSAPALFAEQWQWSSKLDTITSDVSAMAIGAVVLSTTRLDRLPGDLKTLVMETGKAALAALQTRIRSEDGGAFTRLKGKMTVVTPTAAEKSKWASRFKKARQRLSGETFLSELVTKLEGLAK